MSHVTLLRGNAVHVLPALPAESVHCVVTSPPYWGLRDYSLEPQVWGGLAGCAHEWKLRRRIHRGGDAGAYCGRCDAWRGHLGLEPTPELYLEHMVGLFREVRRVLRKDGTLWLNMGDSYTDSGRGADTGSTLQGSRRNQRESRIARDSGRRATNLRPKNLLMMPARLALALQADDWWLRAEIVWSKPSPMPESVTDRPTRAHEYIYLFARSERYFYDAAAIAEPAAEATLVRIAQATVEQQQGGLKSEQYAQDFPGKKHRDRKPVEIVQGLSKKAGRQFDDNGRVAAHDGGRRRPPDEDVELQRNARTVWDISTQPYPEAHFATFPEELARRCIVAGSSPRTCEHCGAPWKRIVVATGGTIGRAWNDHQDDLQQGNRAERRAKGNEGGYRREERGWKPTCRCEQEGTGRSVVLDPFGGSGTTAQVATGNGRDAIYIDLNPEYLDLARQRIGPLLCRDP